MLESVLADVLTRILGQYLEGIDRDSVRFGAWSGLVELRGVALRPEALAVLFETLGMDLPVTVEAGFIGLLSLQVPWKAIGSQPVRIVMEDVTIMARPVRGDGSDDSELEIRERRIKRAKLSTDDAVREASWGVTPDPETESSSIWSSWLVSDELRAKIIDNVQIHLKGIHLRFEDPFSDKKRPYVASIICDSLEAVSANEAWKEAFVESSPGAKTRKLISLKGFRIDWAPITPKDAPGLSAGITQKNEHMEKRFETPELLKSFLQSDTSSETKTESASSVKSLLSPVNGVMRLQLSGSEQPTYSKDDLHKQIPHVDLHIQFPKLFIDLDDVQYASLLQTSVYFARLSTRGFRPTDPKLRWKWAVDQLLPGCSARRERALRFTQDGIARTRERRLIYIATRKSILQARRNGIDDPAVTAKELDDVEDKISFDEIIAYRDWTDAVIEKEERNNDLNENTSKPLEAPSSGGTTSSAMWRMLGYSTSASNQENSNASKGLETTTQENKPTARDLTPHSDDSYNRHPALALRVAFTLAGATVRIAEKGYPVVARPRVTFNLQNFQLGVLFSSAKDLVVEALLGKVEAWDLLKNRRMVYMRQSNSSSIDSLDDLDTNGGAYPTEAVGIIESIRSYNPATRLLDNQPYSDSDSDLDIDEEEQITDLDNNNRSKNLRNGRDHQQRRRRHRNSGGSSSREPTPPATFRVTEAEFLGNSKDSPDTQKYIAAFQYTQKNSPDNEYSSESFSELDVSVAALEAVVDGPKGSFVWGLKFWKPKGMAQDPIMAFLGAAAGARIAEVRMELEEALVANKVPMKINAFILAPRFVLSDEKDDMPSIVVNMGTLGICTSDHTPDSHVASPPSQDRKIRYSSYVLTLDNLGIYYSPTLMSAISRNLSSQRSDSSDLSSILFENHSVDTTGVERIIQPFCLRFILQTLRDATVVQVAQSSSTTSAGASGDLEAQVAKVRVRGKIPELSLILTKSAFQHILVTARNWSRQLHDNFSLHANDSQVSEAQNNSLAANRNSSGNFAINFSPSTSSPLSDKTPVNETTRSLPTVLASYNVRITMDRVSLDLRENTESRLISAVSTQLCASVVKKGRVGLHANFSLGTWSITDKSRGTTAAFRRLLHAGLFPGTSGVSPPHSQAGSGEDATSLHDEDRHFVNVKYYLDFESQKQDLRLRFLSLNMVCVRETYMKLALFFHQVLTNTKLNRGSPTVIREQSSGSAAHESESLYSTPTKPPNTQQSTYRSEINIVSEFDGFNFQLVASGGVIAVVEMKGCRINFAKKLMNPTRLWGDFSLFSIRDLTAPISEHINVVTYEKPNAAIERMLSEEEIRKADDVVPDEWSLTFPVTTSDPFKFRARFKGINITFLRRFLDVIELYVSALTSKLQPIFQSLNEVSNEHTFPDVTSEYSSKKSDIDITLNDLTVRLPRNSSCASENIVVNLPRATFNNAMASHGLMWTIELSLLQMDSEYMVRQEKNDGSSMFASSFLRNLSLSIFRTSVQQPGSQETDALEENSLSTSISISDPVCINLCEAQYTVLYFVMTENFAETIQGTEVEMASYDFDFQEEFPTGNNSRNSGSIEFAEETDNTNSSERNHLNISEKEEVSDSTAKTAPITVRAPAINIEISRGWDVSEDTSKILGFYVSDLDANFLSISGKRLWLELTGNLSSIQDLRQEQNVQDRTIAARLVTSPTTGDDEVLSSSLHSFRFTYEKCIPNRPSITMLLSGMQLEVSPDLFQDLTYLAIPGWPYLETSGFAPDYIYLGRIVNVEISKSQVMIRSKEDDQDKRAIGLTGEFQLHMEWMRNTGAKRISLRSMQVEVGSLASAPEFVTVTGTPGITNVLVEPFQQNEVPLFYPADSLIEYVGPEVDKDGCRLNVSTDAMLSVIDTSQLSLLKSVLTRPTRMKKTYLSQRDWKQPVSPSEIEPHRGVKEEQKKKAKANMIFSMTIPVARYLVTDSQEEHTVPILETRLMSFTAQAHGGNTFQVDGNVSMDLFNPEKGWWEPALEPWDFNASMSKGQSGSQAFVIKSEQRLNINIAPASVTAAKKVANALQNIGRSREGEKARSKHLSRRIRAKAGTEADKSSRAPSVAAFVLRNQLGLPISIGVVGKSEWIKLASDGEIEVGAETENLLESAKDNGANRREKILTCTISVPSYLPTEVSATEVGKHIVELYPSIDSDNKVADYSQGHTRRNTKMILWEVEMSNGVPLCSIRSLYRIVNETQTSIQLGSMETKDIEKSPSDGSGLIRQALRPGESFPVPMEQLDETIVFRPEATQSQPSTLFGSQRPVFDWSFPLPSTEYLYGIAQKVEDTRSGHVRTKQLSGASFARRLILSCKSFSGTGLDFSIEVVSKSGTFLSNTATNQLQWLDILLQAPIILTNRLPRTLSYRFLHRDAQSTNLGSHENTSQVVLAAGPIESQQNVHVHISSENLNTCSLSLAYDNQPVMSNASLHGSSSALMSSVFGDGVRLDELTEETVRSIYPSPGEIRDSNGQIRKEFRATIRPSSRGTPHFNIFAGIWVRNRSDTPLEVCSRTSFYAPGSLLFRLRERPPFEEPDPYVCCEGPYISLRIPSGFSSSSSQDTLDHSNWWTISLDDLRKPSKVSLKGKSLEIDARPAIGTESQTFIVTIRNTSWIVNSTPKTLQWCRSGSLDPHGNCRAKDVNILTPGKAQGMHWESKSSLKAIHLRIANSDGASDWIWSLSIPLDVGHSRELPAKMYRPKSQEQYIARLRASPINGSSDALVIYGEDKGNPPYRIVNLCRERAIAFSQVDTLERPWLVRNGKSTRYAWDDPLALQEKRRLSIRVIEPEDLQSKRPSEQSSSSETRPRQGPHPTVDLNIDIVKEPSLVLTDSYDPPVTISVTVQGATKIVTFSDRPNESELSSSTLKKNFGKEQSNSLDSDSTNVPTVGWDHVDVESSSIVDPSKQRGKRKLESHKVVDYPLMLKPRAPGQNRLLPDKINIDMAVFLDSIGISLIDNEPCEFFYVCAKGIFINYECFEGLHGIGLSIKHLQVDNQLMRTPYPILFWMGPRTSKQLITQYEAENDEEKNALEFRCNIRDQDILMIEHLYVSPNHCYLSFEDDIVSKMVQFVSETAIFGLSNLIEPLTGRDEDQEQFEYFLPLIDQNSGTIYNSKKAPSSRRIYVRDFRIDGAMLRLTSAGSGAALAKAAGINSSARSLFALILNVENCDFSFQPLLLQHVFDTAHHFALLVRTYYLVQLSNQKMKLLASNVMGRPAALFDAVGVGAREFFTEPGKATKSTEFISKFGKGSKSLFANTVGGIVESVSSIPRAVSSGLEKAVGDADYLAERERIRGSNLAGGSRGSSSRNPLATGATSFAHGISSGVTGLFREPVQGARQGGASGLLKGIGKAVIGGVAKPVAGAMDLVAEPASGLARQIVDINESFNSNMTPERPPRTFRGMNQRLHAYDMRHAVGTCLYRAVEHGSGLRYDSELIQWVELSGREGRNDPFAVEWTWDIVKRYSRSVSGIGKRSRSAHSSKGHSIEIGRSSRIEKTKVALITESDVLIVTLDCKLLTAIPLWVDANYSIEGEGNQVIITGVIPQDINPQTGKALSGFEYPLISAPWDPSSTGRRRKPPPGEAVVNRIACGSNEARDDLKYCLKQIVEKLQKNVERKMKKSVSTVEAFVSSTEMCDVSDWEQHDNGIVMKSMGNRNDFATSSGPSIIDDARRLSNVSNEESNETRNRYYLERIVERLTQESKRLSSSKRSLRIIIVNKLSDGYDLIVENCELESGRWRSEIPNEISSMNAKMIEADVSYEIEEKSEEICGMILYKIMKQRNVENMNEDEEVGRVVIDLFSGKDGASSFTTNGSEGFEAIFERGDGNGAMIFNITESKTNENENNTTRVLPSRIGQSSIESYNTNMDNCTNEENTRNEEQVQGMSDDERLLQQLLDIGFKMEDAIVALSDAKGDIVQAVDILTRKQN